ncbi:NAD-dependent epimerase/dehydratase family protein [Halosegnis sp.]|uniref:NAD-dependent epimerase/dehydratase family protein n=1 Tax=Halosegnis sp. TaxID=2864959 RepID=UPI0035D4BD09
MTHVLVTGGCGYIGSVLVPLLRRDGRVDRVTVMDDLSSGTPRALAGQLGDETVQFRQGDVRQYGDVEAAAREADAVIHLAAITGAASTHDRREATIATNYDGTENVCTAAGKTGVDTLVFASSCNVYGRAPTTDIDETVAPEPINPYAETKRDAEQLVAETGEEFGVDTVSLRLATNYGDAPGVRFNLVVNSFVFRALTGRPLTVYGDGSNWRPFIHVRDAARAYRAAALAPADWPQNVYNVGATDENYRVADVARLVSEEVAPVDITYLEDEHPGPSYHVNFDRLDETGFAPEWTLCEGIRDLQEAFVDE